MKENVWKKSFVAGPYKIKDLSLGNQLELSILSDEIRAFWQIEVDVVKIKIDELKAAMKSGELKDVLQRAGDLLPDIIEDMDFETMGAYEVFFLIPDIQWEIKKYKDALKKK